MFNLVSNLISATELREGEVAEVNKAPISTLQAVGIFFALVLVVIVIAFIKKTYYRYHHKKRYFVMPRLGVKGLAYIGMVIAVSVSIIIIFATITSGAANALFRAMPGSRVAIESVLIKIGGLLFGPILGLFIGAAIDFLTIALSGGVFNYGYLISAMAFGMFAGFIRILIDYSQGKDLNFAIYSSILIAIAYAGLSLLIYFVKFSGSNPDEIRFEFFQDSSDPENVTYKISIPITKVAVIGILGGFFAVFIIVIWVTLWISKKFPHQKNIFKFLAPVIVMVVISEILVNLLLLPVFDAEINRQDYWIWFAARFAVLPFLTILNIVVLYSVYRIIGPLVKYNYTDDLIEDINRPLIYK